MAPMMRAAATLALCLSLGSASEQRASVQAVANPIRKVVTLLTNMQAKVKAEGEKEEELYEKFMCYCKTGVGELEARIEAAGTKGPQLEADIKESEEKLVQTKQALKDAQKEREEAKEAIASAEAIREKDAKAFAATKAELDEYISQMSGAVTALESGMAGSFLQAKTKMSALRQVVQKAESASDDDKETVLSFLSGKYAPKSGEITGILKAMGDEFAATLKTATEAEEKAIKETEALVSAKKKEIETLTVSIESKLTLIGELGTAIVTMKADFEDVAGDLLDDKKLLADLKKGCATKDAEYEARVKTRNEELAALADTIKILNDDDSLELFKKTLPSPSASFMQLRTTEAQLRSADLQFAKLEGAHFGGADLSEATARHVRLTGAKLPGAMLRECDLRESSGNDVDLSGAVLDGAGGVGQQAEDHEGPHQGPGGSIRAKQATLLN